MFSRFVPFRNPELFQSCLGSTSKHEFSDMFFRKRNATVLKSVLSSPGLPWGVPPLELTNQRYFADPRSSAQYIKKSRVLWRLTNQNKRIDHVIGELIRLPTHQIFVFAVFANFLTIQNISQKEICKLNWNSKASQRRLKLRYEKKKSWNEIVLKKEKL